MEKKYTLRKAFLFIPILCLLQIHLYAQERMVSGRVTSPEDAQGLPGVNVLVKGTTTGTVTDVEGNYKITVPGEDVTLVYSYVGYETKEVPVNGRSQIDVQISIDMAQLDEIVVIGYGEQSRATLTTAVSKLDNKVLENIPYANVTNALQGSVSGLRVSTVSGQPGEPPRVVLRGGASINDPEGAVPLYIVDGVIRQDILGINPKDIESVQVLKDAASTSIYGSRGSNGVIIITTKTGRAGEISIDYNYSVSVSELQKKIPLGNAREYIQYGRLGVLATSERSPERLNRLDGAFGYGTGNDLTPNTPFAVMLLTDDNQDIFNNTLVGLGWESMPDPADPSQTIIFKDTDYQDVLFRTGVSHNHYVSVSGGSEKATFRAGLGYLDSEGITIFTDFQRFNFNLNGTIKAGDNLTVSGGVSYINTKDAQVFRPQHAFQRWLGVPPTTKFENLDGTLNAGSDASRGNPMFLLQQYVGDNEMDQTTLNLGLDWEVLPGLIFKPTASLYLVNDQDNLFQPSYTTGRGAEIDARTSESSQLTWRQKQLDAVLSYSKELDGGHNFQFDGGFSYFDRERFRLRAVGQNAATNIIPTLNASATPVEVFSDKTKLRILGYFGRLNYDYQAKYLFSFSFRYDGASNLGAENLWGFFPGVSAGWNLHKEAFWDNMPSAISQFKLRGSFGVNGNISGVNGSINGRSGNDINNFSNFDGLNQILGDFASQGEFDAGAVYGGRSAIRNTVLPNPDLQWERSKTVDIGFDAGLMNNRITLLFDYYRRETDNLLTEVRLPESTGFVSTITNLASFENEGVEMELQANILSTSGGLIWDVSANASFNKSKILKLPDNGVENNRIGGVEIFDPATGGTRWVEGFQEGQAIGDFYTWQDLGVYATEAEAAEAPLDPIITRDDITKTAGDAILADLNNDGITDTKDLVFAGNIFPKWTGGFTNTLSYKGLTLTVRTDFTLGHTIYNQSRARFDGQWQGDLNITKDVVNDSWLSDRTDGSLFRYYWADQLAQNNNFRNAGGRLRSTSRYYEEGDFLNLREVTLSYNLPSMAALEKIGLSNVRVYATGNNLKYFTNYTYQVPEVEGNGLDAGRYPNPRSYIFGINVSF